jgi:hypothetical protein
MHEHLEMLVHELRNMGIHDLLDFAKAYVNKRSPLRPEVLDKVLFDSERTVAWKFTSSSSRMNGWSVKPTQGVAEKHQPASTMQHFVQVEDLTTAFLMISLLSKPFEARLTRQRFSANPGSKARCCCLDVITEGVVHLEERLHETGVLAEFWDSFDVRRELHRECHDLGEHFTAGIPKVTRRHRSKIIVDFTKAKGHLILDEWESGREVSILSNY